MRPEPHRALVVVSALTLLAATVMVLLGAFRIGVTTDEPFHVQRYDNYRATGWYLADFQMDDGRPGTGVTDQFVYAPAAMTLLHGLNELTGTDDPDSVGESRTAYQVRHLGIALIGLLGVAAAVVMARIVLGSWRWGLVAGAALGAMPLWTGLAMFDVKDTPVASGFALITLGLTLAARREPGSRLLRLGTPAALAAGVLLCVGTRPGMWAGVVPGVIVVLVLAGASRRRLLELAVGLGAGLASACALYPKVFLDPSWPYHAVTSSADFGTQRADRTFVPLHVAVDLPLLLTGLAVVGAVVVLTPLVRKRGRALAPAEIGGVLLLAQATALPAVTLVRSTAIQNDLRHLLFAAPEVAVLAAVGALALISRRRAVASGLVAAALVLPTVDQATLFPYNYVWTNPLDALRSPEDTENRDHMAASFATAAGAAGPVGRIICSKPADPGGPLPTVPARFDDEDCPAFAGTAVRDRPVDLLSPVFYRVGMTYLDRPNCAPVAEVTRLLHGHRTTISALARCTRPVGVLRPDRAIVPERPGSLAPLGTGWLLPEYGRPNAWGHPGARATGDRATLVFTTPERLLGEELVLVLRGRIGSPTTARVNGVDVAAERGAHTLRIPLGIAGSGPVLVELTGRPLALEITGLDLRH